MSDLGDEILDISLEDEVKGGDAPATPLSRGNSSVSESPSGGAAAAGIGPGAASADAEVAQALALISALPIAKQGYLLKKCRHRGDQKPWKRRWFTLRGSSLLYYPTKDAMATLRPKLFIQLSPQSTVTADAPEGYEHALRVVSGLEVMYVGAGSKSEAEGWQSALATGCGAPGVDMGSVAGAAVSGLSLGTRMKMSMASAVATSSIGQAMLTRYLDPSARELLRQLVRVAATQTDEKRAGVLKSYLLDIAARLIVIVSEGRIPSDTNLDVLHEDTLSFTQDFLMYSRDQRLKDVRGPEAEVVPIDLPSLVTPFSRVAAVWRTIMEGSCKPAVLTRFDELFAFFVDPNLIMQLLVNPKLRPQLVAIDAALRRLLEVF